MSSPDLITTQESNNPIQCLIANLFTFPYSQAAPTQTPKLTNILFIALLIPSDFGSPELLSSPGHPVATTDMAMPETAIHKYYSIVFR